MTVTDYAASPVVLVINEVYFQERFAGEEAVEIYNPTPLPVDLAGLRLTDGNVLIGDIDVVGPTGGPSTSPSRPPTPSGCPSVLPADGYAVVWMGPCGGESVAPAAALQYSAGMAGLYVLDDPGDDVWLLDAGSRLVDYVAWSQGAGHEMNTPPPVSFWDPAYLRRPRRSGSLLHRPHPGRRRRQHFGLLGDLRLG